MRWFSIGRLEVGFGGGRLIVATTGRISRILVDWGS